MNYWFARLSEKERAGESESESEIEKRKSILNVGIR
jgi:hypothetical protein